METWTDEDEGIVYISCSALTVGDYGGYGDIGEANIRALGDTEGATVHNGAYYSRQLWLLDTEDNREIVRGLEEEYPVYCDKTHDTVRQEWEDAAWNNYGRWDSLRDLGDEWGKVYHALEGVEGTPFTDEVMDKARYLAECEGDGTLEWVYEYSGAAMRIRKDDYRECVCKALRWPVVDLECEGERAMLCDWLTEQGREGESQVLREHFGL